RRHARKADVLPFPMDLHVESAGAQKLHLRRLHEAEEIGEVDDLCHVGVAELDAACRVEHRTSCCCNCSENPGRTPAQKQGILFQAALGSRTTLCPRPSRRLTK